MNTSQTRRSFLKTVGVAAVGTTFAQSVCADNERRWKVAVVQDTSKASLGGHGLETAFYGLSNIEMVAHVDSNAEDIEKRMAVSRAKRHYPSITAMFEHEKPDIVVLTSRHPLEHLPQIREVAENGAHVYCEKPLAASLEDADAMVALAEKYGTKMTVGHPRRYDLGYVTMKRLIESGKIGVPMTMQGWAKCDHRGGGEDLLVLGTHTLDLFVFLFGNPERVSAEVYVDGKPFADGPLTKTVEPIGPTAGDEIFATFRFPGGVRGVFETRRGLYSHAKKDYRMGVSVIGSTGMLSQHFSDAHPERQPLRYTNSPCTPATVEFSEHIPLKEDRDIPGAIPIAEAFGKSKPNLGPIFAAARRYAVWDLMRAIEEDRQPICSVHDARTVMEMIYGVYASHVQNRPIEFPLQDRTHPLKNFTR